MTIIDLVIHFYKCIITCALGNIVLMPGSSTKILARDVFLSTDVAKAAEVMVESADTFAPIIVWTPEFAGSANGRKDKRKETMHDMWRTAFEGLSS